MKHIQTIQLSYPNKLSLPEIIKQSKYSSINYLVSESVSKGKISLNPDARVKRNISIYKFEHQDSLLSSNLVAFAKKANLEIPTLIDGILLGYFLNSQEFEGSIVFLHEPRYFWSGFMFNLVLEYNHKVGKKITFKSTGGYWTNNYYFAFRNT